MTCMIITISIYLLVKMKQVQVSLQVRLMVTFIETFYLLTLKVSSSKYVTKNVHFKKIIELDIILKEMKENEDPKLVKSLFCLQD